MKMPSFEYAAPTTLVDAVALLAKHSGEAKIIAGGQSLLPIMAFRLASPAVLVDIAGIPDLRAIRIENDGLHLGPLVRWCEIERSGDIANHHPLLKEAVSHIAHYQVRNRGTIGGSLAHADPAGELPCIAVTCSATLSLFSGSGVRKVKAEDFILGELETNLRTDEIIVDVHFPRWPETRRWAFKEFARRRGDFALGGVAVYLDLDPTGTVTDCAIGIMGASARALRLTEIENMLVGSRIEPKVIERAAMTARSTADPSADIHASREYRKALIGTLVERALNAALSASNGANMQ